MIPARIPPANKNIPKKVAIILFDPNVFLGGGAEVAGGK
jgi:hypothetical protein